MASSCGTSSTAGAGTGSGARAGPRAVAFASGSRICACVVSAGYCSRAFASGLPATAAVVSWTSAWSAPQYWSFGAQLVSVLVFSAGIASGPMAVSSPQASYCPADRVAPGTQLVPPGSPYCSAAGPCAYPGSVLSVVTATILMGSGATAGRSRFAPPAPGAVVVVEYSSCPFCPPASCPPASPLPAYCSPAGWSLEAVPLPPAVGIGPEYGPVGVPGSATTTSTVATPTGVRPTASAAARERSRSALLA